jgi:hypothetical protein
MNAKQKAAQIYDEYWSDVSKKPVSKQDPLPDMRPLLEKAIIEAVEAEREECAKIADGWHSDCALIDCDEKQAAEMIAVRIRARS